MLSYQHAYHAGSRADIHKHKILCQALEILTRKERPLAYFETHAGRGIYDLRAVEAEKTGEAKEGWLKFSQDNDFLAGLPQGYADAVRKLNAGEAQGPAYPGSPYIAAHLLRPQDHMHLMELHPQEYEALVQNFRNDARIHVHKRDGYEGVTALTPPRPPVPRRGLVLIDPSYEVKTEYETAAAFVYGLSQRWPEAVILLWLPVLEAGRHNDTIALLERTCPGMTVMREEWDNPGRGMRGSIMLGLNMPFAGEASG